MSIHKMTRAQLIAKIERDAQAVQRAAGLTADNERLQEQNRKFQADLKAERNKPPREVVKQVVKRVPERVEVPGPERVVTKTVSKPAPCPKQAEKIKALRGSVARTRSEAKQLSNQIADQHQQIASLQSQLDKFAQCDMDEFNKWARMRDVAKGKP